MNLDEVDFFRHLKKEDKLNIALNLIKSLDDRSLGHFKKNVKSKEDRELYAEEEFIRKENYDELQCEMPGMPRSTFLMVFSPDGTKVASTHGNHNIYVTDICSGKNVKTLVGHPRTPWCIAFHPTSNQIVASGCLGGQVRIWDLSGGSEVWTASNQSVIASIAFHPNDRILVIATINEVYFWDWSKPEPFCHTATENQKEKVRFVAFDKLGHKLITGISNSQNRWEYVRSSVPVSRPPERSSSPYRRRITHRVFNFPSPNNVHQTPANSNVREPLSTVPERERNITLCYRNLVREYGRLVQRYLQLYRPPAMIDRGTDPMEHNTLLTSSSSTQVPEQLVPNEPGPSRIVDNNPSTSNQNQLINNPYQLLTPSRILAVMNRPATLIRGTQTSESRKHKAETCNDYKKSTNEKKIKVDNSSPEETTAESKYDDLSTDKDLSQPGTSKSTKNNSSNRLEKEQLLEDIIHRTPSSKIRSEQFETALPSSSPLSEINDSLHNPNISNVTTNVVISSKETKEIPNGMHSENISSTNIQNAVLENPICTNVSSHNSTSKPTSQNALMSFLNNLPKTSKATQNYSQTNRSDGSSTSETSDYEQRKESRRRNVAQQTTGGDRQGEMYGHDSRHSKTDHTPSFGEGTSVDSSPGTSRGATERDSRPREAKRLELMMMSIRHNAEDKLRSRFLPLIRSVPENDRLELIRLFEQGVKESREKARMRYRNMGQMFNKKTNRRPILDTSSDTSSSEDERDSLHENFFNHLNQNDTERLNESSLLPTESTDSTRIQQEPESNEDAYHNINNLENWVTSLFDDIDPQNNSANTTSGSTTQLSTSTSTSNSVGNSLNRPARFNRLHALRRVYAQRVLRGRANSRSCASSSVPPRIASTSVQASNSAGITNTRNTNYLFARRRFGAHRASAFLPTRVYYPRTPPEFRRNRQFPVGRWRLNQRPYRSHNISSRLIPRSIPSNNSNSASDEVINFSELPNSEDDPVPSFERRSAGSSAYYPYHFHPFNPPPNLPTINPENIGIGNMYSNIVQDLEVSLNDVRNIRAANRPGEMSDMLSNFSERLENIMNQSETILRNLRTSVEMLPANNVNSSEQRNTVPTASFNDENFYIRDQRTEVNELERSMGSILGENPSNNVTSDHTYPRNSDFSTSTTNTSDSMSPLMTSLHLTISHIQRQARLLRQQVESIERIDRAMVEVAQLQLMRLLLVELSRYVRSMSGESRSTSMSSVRQMMAGTRISDSSPGECQSSDNVSVISSTVQSQPSTSNTSSDVDNMPSARTRGISHKTYPPSRLSRLQKRRSMFIHHAPRRHALRLPPSLRTPSASLNLEHQSMLHMYSRINTFTLNRMSRRLDLLINEHVNISMQRSFVRLPLRISGGNMGEQSLAMRLRNSITRTNQLVGSSFEANVVRNYRIDTTAISRDEVDRFYARQTLSFIIDGISTHLDETRGSPLPHNIRLQLQCVMTMSMLLSELLLLHIVDSIPPPTDMNLDQERQSLTNRIDQMCTTMMLSSRFGGYSTNLTHSLRQLQTMIRQNFNQPSRNLFDRTPLSSHARTSDGRSRAINRTNRIGMLNRMRNTLNYLPNRTQERSVFNQSTDVTFRSNINNAILSRDRESVERRIHAFRRMHNAFHSLYNRLDDSFDQNRQTVDTLTEESTGQAEENATLRTRTLEARTRALHRLQIMDRLRNSLIPSTRSNRFHEQYEQTQAQNSESDDGSRPTGSDQRRDLQAPESSSQIGNWQGQSWNQQFSSHPNEEVSHRDSLSTNESSNSSNRLSRISPSHRSPSNVNSTASLPSSSFEELPGVSRWPWNVPSVQVNDVPVSEFGPSQESSESDNPPNVTNNSNNNTPYPTRGVMARLAAIRAVNHPLGVFRPRFLHPLYASVNPFDADLDDPQREHIYDSDVITTVTPNHRIQVWDMSDSLVPVINNPLKNVVVGECKIHNDASVDIATDGSILVTLLPSGGYLNVTNRLGVYSLKWETLGQCLYTTSFDHNAVSVSLSPLGSHLVVGLASRRVSIVPSERWMMARIFKIEQKDIPGDRLPIVRELDQSRDGRATSHKSVNCIRWLPSSGQGLIYATNTGQLVIWT